MSPNPTTKLSLKFAIDSKELEILLGDCLLKKAKQPFKFKTICTDSRQVNNKDLFVALSGDNHDAHDFINKGMMGKVAGVLVEKPIAVNIPSIQVKSTRQALALMARHKIQSFTGEVVVLTGSVGKTTNKEMLASVLAVSHRVFATQGNLNNDIGVPFTIFSMPKDMDYAVIEMGANHQGEIAHLANIVKSDVAMITNAEAVHLEGFGGLAGVAMGKGEIFNSLKTSGIAVINLDDAYADYWQSLCIDKKVMRFSQHDKAADVYAESISPDKTHFQLVTKQGRIAITLPQGGVHMIQNALGVAACALALGICLDDISKGIANYRTIKGRYNKQQYGEVTVIDDSYNASPVAVAASAKLLENESGTKIFVLGDMKELGLQAIDLHLQTAEKIKNSADYFLCLGELTAAMMPILGDKGRHFNNMEALCDALWQRVNQEKNCSVLIKGSLSMQMGKAVAFLKEKLQQSQQLGQKKEN